MGRLLLFVFIAVFAVAAFGLGGMSRQSAEEPPQVRELDGVPATPPSQAQRYPVTTRPVLGPAPIMARWPADSETLSELSCAVCHSSKPANREAISGRPLELFHQGLQTQHGTLKCVACHNEQEGYANLKLADGTKLEFSDSIQLCAQCHGTQYRDYQHGSHGGMTGYWDLQRGPRQRNSCVHCHDAHAPKFPHVQPASGPSDRFLTPANTEADHE